MSRPRSTLAALALVAAAACCAAPAQATDSYPCEKATSLPFSPDPVQRCPLVGLQPDGAPLYATPLPNPAGQAPPAPTSWVRGAGGYAYFVCDSEFPEAVFYHPEGWRNRWWAYTRSYDGAVWGWVPEVYLRGGADDEGDAGLRRCPPPPPPPPPPPAPPAPAPPDPCDPLPVSGELRLQALIGRARAVSTRWGRRVTIRGTLAGTSGAPLPNAQVCVSEQAAAGGAARTLTTVTTDAAGAFALTLEPGASRRLRFVHRVGAGAVSAAVTVRVRAPLRLRASRRRIGAGRTVVLSGELAQAPRGRGLLVELQARRGRGFATFGTTRTDRRGAFRYTYRFSRAGAGSAFSLRARMPAQRGLAFAPGASRALRVRVTGG